MIKSKSMIAIAALTGAMSIGSTVARADVEIEYWQYFFEARVTAMDTLIENFQVANPGITVNTNQFPYADYRTKVAKLGAYVNAE